VSTVTSGSTAAAAAATTTAAARPNEAEREVTRDGRVLLVWLAAIGVGVLALGASLWRLMPGIGFWDTAEFQMVGPVMGTAHPTGYPTYVLVGWLASVLLQPLGEAALRMNVLSAILVAVGAAFSVDLVRRLSGSIALGVAGGIGIALTPIVWAVGTHADPHSLHFALLAIILWLLVRWEESRRGSAIDAEVRPATNPRTGDRLLIAAAIVTGLAVGNHSLTLLLGPGILLFVLAVEPGIVRRRRFIAACIAAFAIPTVLVRFEMILRAGWLKAPFVYADPSTWSGFWYVTLGAQFHGWLTDPFANAGGRIVALVDMAVTQLGPLAPLALLAFIVTGFRQPRWALLSGTTLVLTCFFNSVYPDGAIDRYYIGPVLIAWTWLAILAGSVIDWLVGRGDGDRPRGIAAPSRAALRSIGLGGLALVLLVPTVLSFSGRANLVDRTGDRAAQVWTDEILSTLAPNAVVLSWWSFSTPLWYATIVDGRRPDVAIIDDRTRLDCGYGELDQVIDLYLPTRPVYLIRNGDWELPTLTGRFQLVPAGGSMGGNLIQVLPLPGGEAQPGSAPAPAACAAIQ
jgi:hypothetical protein